jgi:hypothetical protein
MLRKLSPSELHTCIQKLGITPDSFLWWLVVAKKLYVRHGMQLIKKEAREAISTINPELATIIELLHALGYKTAESIGGLIREVARHEDFFICRVDASQDIDEQTIDALIEQHVHTNNIYTSTTLSSPGIHITSDTHRYERTLSDDMDAMLGKLHTA